MATFNWNNSPAGKAYKKKWEQENREKKNKYAVELKRKFRQMCIDFLGGKCECCGESQYEFLAIDHVNGGGGKERQIMTSQQLYRKIVKEKITEGYRILCHNCNMAIAFYPQCPHKVNAEA